MKKTFATILAIATLATAASAETLGTSTFTLTSGNASGVTVNNSSTALTLTLGEVSGSGATAGTAAYLYWTSGHDDVKSMLAPHWNAGKGGSWTQTFTLTNTGTETITVTSLTLSMVGITSSGGYQVATSAQGAIAVPEGQTWVNSAEGTANKPVTMSVTDGGSLVYNIATGSAGLNNQSTGTFTGMEWELAAGQEVQFTVTADNNSLYTGGAFPAITSMAFSGDIIPAGGTDSIPEPTTATLSLLALAGLAARRRRK